MGEAHVLLDRFLAQGTKHHNTPSLIKTFRHKGLQGFFEAVMTRMPLAPRERPSGESGDITITEAAVKLRVNRVTHSRVVSGSAGVSADMPYQFAQAFNTSAEMWAGMQMEYDLYPPGKLKRPKIERLAG
jgi:addiction module HigA family antidote